MGKEFANQL